MVLRGMDALRWRVAPNVNGGESLRRGIGLVAAVLRRTAAFQRCQRPRRLGPSGVFWRYLWRRAGARFQRVGPGARTLMFAGVGDGLGRCYLPNVAMPAVADRRVVITGLGIVSPLGDDLGAFWSAL